MHFARNTADADALQAYVAATPDAMLWALVDVALLERSRLDRLGRLLGWQMENALWGSSLEPYGEHAPVWIALPTPVPDAAQGLARLLALDPCAPALSLVSTRGDLPALQALAAYLSRARLDGDMLTHCRFADTRVLPVLLSTLAPPQLRRIAQTVQAWTWIDHLGRPAQWRAPMPEAAAPVDSTECLELDTLQFSTMLDASEPDTMFSLLREHTPELVPAQGRGDFRDRLAGILGQADRRRLTAPNDRLQFITLALACGDGFDEAAELQPLWRDIVDNKTSLLVAVQGWDDALWDRLQSAAPKPGP